MANSIRIIIADDELLFRKGLARLLGEFEGIQVVGEASNGKELLQQLHSWPQEPPQVLLLDISMPEMDGITAFPQIHHQFPDLKIIILTIFSDDRHIITMIEAGAHGYLVKNSEPDEVKRAIVTVIEHDYYFNDRTLRAMQKSMQRRKNRSAMPVDTELTARETEILELICHEYTAVEIAKRLFISERTVDRHVSNILTKLDVASRTAATALAYRRKLI